MSSGQRPPVAAPTGGPPPAATASHGGSRAFGLGSRRSVRVACAILTVALLGALAGVLLTRHSSSAAGHSPSGAGHGASAAGGSAAGGSAARYGGIPSWLPKPRVPVGRIADASRAHPALAIQGEAVSVELGGARVLATAVGPSVPEEGRIPVPATSPCTFIVTFAHASGVIPLSATAFTLIDEHGHVRHPSVTDMSGGPPPRLLLPGRTVSLTVHDVLPTGDGGLTWAPEGGQPIVSWDFTVEID